MSRQRWWFVVATPDGRQHGMVTATTYEQAMAMVRKHYTNATTIEVMAVAIRGEQADVHPDTPASAQAWPVRAMQGTAR